MARPGVAENAGFGEVFLAARAKTASHIAADGLEAFEMAAKLIPKANVRPDNTDDVNHRRMKGLQGLRRRAVKPKGNVPEPSREQDTAKREMVTREIAALSGPAPYKLAAANETLKKAGTCGHQLRRDSPTAGLACI